MYTKGGQLLQGSRDPKPVLEYIVFQKRLWYDSPWVARERFYENVDAKYATID